MAKTMREMTRADLEAFLKKRDGDQCMFPACDRPLDDERDINTIDHIYPQFLARAAGWTRDEIDALDNLQLMHKSCNTIKGHQLPDEDGNFQIIRREPKPIKLPRPEVCELCLSGRILLIGETCPVCESGPQPAKWPGSLQRRPKDCDHSTFHCFMCVAYEPELRVKAIQRIAFGP